MKSYRLTFEPSPASQVVRPSGRGYITLMIISHAESSAQAVTLYDKDGVTLARYQVAPGASPYTLAFPLPHTMWFTNGLLVHTGSCHLNIFLVY